MGARTTILVVGLCLAMAGSDLSSRQSEWVVVLRVHIVEKEASPVVSVREGERAELEVTGFGSFDFSAAVDDSDSSRVTVRIYEPESEGQPADEIVVSEGEAAVATDTSPSFEVSVLRVFRLD